MTRLSAHPVAELFPLLEGEEFLAFVGDIRDNGVRDRIELLDGAILDGRNRYNALVYLSETGEVLGEGWGHRAGEALSPEHLEPDNAWFHKFNQHADGNPIKWVISKNLKRRHLDESQRGLVAGRLANMRQGERTDLEPSANLQKVSTAEAARALSVSERTASSGRKVAQHGVSPLQKLVEQGRVALSAAEPLAGLPPDEQSAIVAKGEKDILAAAKEIRARDRRVRFAEVNKKLAQISEHSKALPTGQQFPIIYADPATRYVSGFGNRSIENHYPTMTTEELCALPVSDLATSSALLMIWSTVPQLGNAFEIIKAWGFHFVSDWCWDKVVPGTGHWSFNQHEHLLIATRGEFPAPVPGTQPRSLYREAKTDHSVKPDWFAEQIERLWPDLPKIELFAREARPGWSAWGNQSEVKATPPDVAPPKPALPVPSSDDALELPSFLKRAADNVAPFVKPENTPTIGDPHAPHH